MAAWEKGRRHQTWWASNTAITAVGAITVFIITGVVDILNGPEPAPAYLTGLCGLAGAWLFGVAGSDKQKRDGDVAKDARTAKSRVVDVNNTAINAEAKADQISEIIAEARPDLAEKLPPPLIDKPKPKSKPGGES